ncbi:FadR/GntR family transcriptional regulator [Sphingomonas sp. BK235]|uniref:FadR/GntR family transcriptional regulator n=1 Tax=Sphingomonas sp. BK235 TaxID=2512131 RepID=UPI00104523EF|nr:FadR/GntR family transcriptional regulator [Sphingomonas sp. BK235]TCP36507.1 DNA-binding FadR family transcriptional regulator [Sphingomonas sp. BK235]
MTNGERRGPAHVTLARRLGVAIVTGQYPSGAVLPGELELAGQFGVSRSVIRESLRMLSAKGLVESRPKAGTRVRERALWNLLDPELLAWMFEGAPSLGFVRSLFQLRMIVEPAAAELAAVQRSAAQLSRMGHALEVMAQHGLRTQDGQTADQRFHATILEATGNELLVSLSSSIAAAVRWTTFFKYRVPLHYRDPIPLHRELFEAIANGDTAAARGVTEQLIGQAGIDTERALVA